MIEIIPFAFGLIVCGGDCPAHGWDQMLDPRVIDLLVCIGVPVAFGVFIFLIDRKFNRSWWTHAQKDEFRPPIGRDINNVMPDMPHFTEDMIHSYRVAVALGDTVTADQMQDQLELMGKWPIDEEV